MRIIVEFMSDNVYSAVRRLQTFGFVLDSADTPPRPEDTPPERCFLVGEMPEKRLNDVQGVNGVVGWQVVGMEP